MSELTEDSEIHEMSVSWALEDLLHAAADFFDLRPEMCEFAIKKQDDGIWVILPDGSQHALPTENEGE